MRRIVRIVILLCVLAVMPPARAQQMFEEEQHYIFLAEGMRFRTLTDSTVEVCPKALQGLPVPDTLVIPQVVTDSLGHSYTVTRIGDDAFNGSGDIDTVVFCDNIREIGNRAFMSCTGLHGIVLPASLRSIGFQAFSYTLIKGTVVLPDTLEYIAPTAFYSAPTPTTWVFTVINEYVMVNGQNFCTIDGVLYSADSTALVLAPSTVGDTFIVPSHVRYISARAFYGSDVRHVELNEQLRGIGIFAFPTSLEGLYLPAAVDRLEGPLVQGLVPDSFVLDIDPGNTSYNFGSNMLLSSDGDTLVMVVGRLNGEKDLPMGLKVVGPYTFSSQDELTNVIMPEGVREIGEWAFSRTSCNINFPYSLRRVGSCILYLNTGVTGAVVLPDGLIDIADSAFFRSQIEDIKLPDSLRVVPRAMFGQCIKLRKIRFGSQLEHIHPYAFAYWSNMPNPQPYYLLFTSLPATLRTVGIGAFKDQIIKRPIFQGSPDTIGTDAFNGAWSVRFYDTVPPMLYPGAFTEADTVILPCGGAAAFTASPYWGPSLTYIETPPCPPVGIEETPDMLVTLSPNPAGAVVHVRSEMDVDAMELMDAGGRILRAIEGGGMVMDISVDDLPAGTYLIRIHTPMGATIKKLTVAR